MPKRKRKNGEDGGGGRKNVNVTIVKYTGVYKSGKRFKAVITIDREGHYLGTFDTSREAAQAYDHAAIQAGHQASKLNFPELMPIEDQPDDDLPMLKSKKPKKVNPGKRTTKRKRAAENISPYPTGISNWNIVLLANEYSWNTWCMVYVLVCCWCVVDVLLVCCCCCCCGCVVVVLLLWVLWVLWGSFVCCVFVAGVVCQMLC